MLALRTDLLIGTAGVRLDTEARERLVDAADRRRDLIDGDRVLGNVSRENLGGSCQ